MKKCLPLLLMIGMWVGCAEGYSHNDLRMLTAYRAKEVCSCLESYSTNYFSQFYVCSNFYITTNYHSYSLATKLS